MSLIRVVSKLSSMEVLPTERRMGAHAGYSGLSAFKKANKTSSILISRLSSIIARRCVWKFLNLGLRVVAHGIFSRGISIISRRLRHPSIIAHTRIAIFTFPRAHRAEVEIIVSSSPSRLFRKLLCLCLSILVLVLPRSPVHLDVGGLWPLRQFWPPLGRCLLRVESYLPASVHFDYTALIQLAIQSKVERDLFVGPLEHIAITRNSEMV
mmetsp:Transcript_87125/g.127435  ORF Transcript_87125/g.127435 Transcript_87125/m.127435 type:complete len:210 (-) Transcript_87125:213-842(-)